MSSSVNGTSRNGKSKQSKNGKNEANSKNVNTNGESFLAPITFYEQTKFGAASTEFKKANKSYQVKLDRLKIDQENVKTYYKTDLDLIVYEKVKGLKAEGLSENISEEQSYSSLHE